MRPPDWNGRTVVCIGSGPSLTPADCELVHIAGHPVVVTNTTFRACPWADALMAVDLAWWRIHHAEVLRAFAGRCFTTSMVAATRAHVQCLAGQPWFRSFRNSGAAAVSLAVAAGAHKVVLVGFDAAAAPGRTHWHGDHPPALNNAASISEWPRLFAALARYAREAGVQVVNASRSTRLECFPRAGLEGAL